MTHGARISESNEPGKWLWDFATSINDSLCLDAPSHLGDRMSNSGIYGGDRDQHWIEWFMEVAGELDPERPGSEFAVYQPPYDVPFSKMCRRLMARPFEGIAVPLGTDPGAITELLT